MAKRKPTVNTSGRIDTPEDYTIRTWLNAEADYLTGGVPVDAPPSEPHPNEVATRQAVSDGVYAAAEVGVLAPKRARKAAQKGT